MKTKPTYYLFTSYQHYRGGLFNLQVTTIRVSGYCDGYIKMFTSTVDNAEKRARSWCKKNGITLAGE